ncbi:unnamed protein product, partial [marine sediment metagenome]
TRFYRKRKRKDFDNVIKEKFENEPKSYEKKMKCQDCGTELEPDDDDTEGDKKLCQECYEKMMKKSSLED